MPWLMIGGAQPCTISRFALVHYAWTTQQMFLLVCSLVRIEQQLCIVPDQVPNKWSKTYSKANLSGLLTIRLC